MHAPGYAPTNPDPMGRAAAEARPTSEDFQESRYKHTQMAGIEGLSEPGADQPRLRLTPGKVVPGTRYRITRWLGEGGMGVVYEAEHIDIERKVALKILRFDLSQEANMAQVFRDEARAASRIGSKNIVEIYDFGELSDGRLFFCMELIPGGDLVPPTEDDWIEPPRLIGLMRQMCKGLSVAHKAGIVHRDIKPENIIIVEDEGREVVKIVDFGISAMLAAGQENGTTIAGTPHYMAPEQISGTKFDGRLDIYAMGCMAYELLVGYPPFLAENIQELLQQQLYEEPKPVKDCRPDREIPQELADVIMRCLVKEPEGRWANMDDFEAALCEAQIAAGITTAWDDLPLPEVESERREQLLAQMPNPNAVFIQQGNRWLWPLIAGATALLLGVGVTWMLVGGDPTEEELSQIDALTNDARVAASKTQWIYPPDDEPSTPTALMKVIELEKLEGTADDAGDERAEELRTEFGATLNNLGDRYWDTPEGKGFAREYYTMALLFDPEDDEARERSGLTPAMLADFQERAAKGEFTEAELSAARWLDVLAEDDKDLAAQKAEALLAMELGTGEGNERSAGSLLVQSRALDAARGAGIAVSSAAPAPAPLPAPVPVAEQDEAGGQAGGQLELDEGETEGEVDEDKPSGKRSGKRARGNEKLGANARNPSKAANLAAQGMAALRAGKRNEAKGLFNQAISYDQRNAMALMGLSDVYFDTGSSQKAVLYAEKAVKAAPKNSNYRIKLGDAYYSVLRYRDALDEYKKAKSYGSSKAAARMAKAQNKIGGG
ncbi:Serine/threonine-protein kinase Pkn1 [Enhygromyxa salina]|uniref:Serine/threonine-protein kinase Pkn1 n=1 Tax=Enhygromyxa salina TaxID=215803 RepID=A0A2S9YH90_9BACT|nr:serine/threonine-protein kinase [Enhygromyxa salina]PRQ04485.1 Serine/threonine-protein kinase Pkn1 [Enhygromyxa salina]